jgi:hypothetical protein
MRAYKVKAPNAFRFAGSQSDASKRKVELVDQFGLKRAQATVEEIEVPTGKVELLEFLNELAKGLDGAP